MRFQLDPTSPSGMSIEPEKQPQQRQQSNGYIGETKISGLITAGSNVTITGTGTKDNPYSIAATGGGSGSSSQLISADGTTITAEDQTSNFGAGIFIQPADDGGAYVVAPHDLNLYAGAADDGTGAFSPNLILGEGGLITIDTSNPATAGANTILMKATDGFAVTSDGVNNAYLSPAGLTSNRFVTFPSSDGRLVTEELAIAMAIVL